jgi:hypothetical protein
MDLTVLVVLLLLDSGVSYTLADGRVSSSKPRRPSNVE